MANRLADAVSPYLTSHAGNPVDWWQWGAEPFAEAARRQVPVLVSIGYATCHWCHVMARESFSDPELAEYLNGNFVAIKVDREEHPDVDASYLAAASAFTPNLGWPLTVFATPDGRAFYAGTYFPPIPVQGHPSFREVLAAVHEAWTERPDAVADTARAVAEALAARPASGSGELPPSASLAAATRILLEQEDREHGGFGVAPKFPSATVLLALLDRASAGDAEAGALAGRCLDAMAASPLRDPVEGGFFRYATQRDWSEPHYERMLYDNALLLSAYARSGRAEVASGIADFLLGVLRRPGGGFASAQDSESVIAGRRSEGGYYALDAAARAELEPPALDEKVLTGWNGLAIESLAASGALLGRAPWIEAAAAAADHLLAMHRRADGTLIRASLGGRLSEAPATLEDYGMFASGLLELALATGEVRYASAARSLVDACLAPPIPKAVPEPLEGLEGRAGSAPEALDGPVPEALDGFAVPGGPDAVLAAQGLALDPDPSEGAYPSGTSAMASAAQTLYLLTAHAPYRAAAEAAMRPIAELALQRPIAFGSALGVLTALAEPVRQLVVVSDEPQPDAGIAREARAWRPAGAVSVVATESQAREFAEAGFELFEGRTPRDGRPAAYLCRDFVCRLPVTDPAELRSELAENDVRA